MSAFWAKHRYKEKGKIASIEYIDEHAKLGPLASLNQSPSPVYDDFTYDEIPHLHC